MKENKRRIKGNIKDEPLCNKRLNEKDLSSQKRNNVQFFMRDPL